MLVGRSISSLIHSSIGVAVMGLTGLLIGWRIHNGLVDGVLAFLLLLLFGFAVIWVGIWVGSLMRTVEAVQGFMFTVMFPLTFVANTFAPTETMPASLRAIAEWNPVSAVSQACRELWGNGPPPPERAWPLQHAVPVSVAWSIAHRRLRPTGGAAFRRRSATEPTGMDLSVVEGDITEQRVDAIVNAANRAMRGGGGVDGAIHRTAGPGVLRSAAAVPSGLATGHAGWTSGQELAARWVIHVVGPNHRAGETDRGQLKSC